MLLMVAGPFGFVFGLIWIAVVVIIITLALRLVKAVEKIADLLEKKDQ